VNLDAFQKEHAARWAELDELLARATRLNGADILRLGGLYRATAADLAYARRRFAGDPLVAGLERRVLRARAVVYAERPRRSSVLAFVTRGYWRRIAERPALVALAWALLLAPAVAALLWGLDDPGAALGLIPHELQAAAEPPTAGRDYGFAKGTAFAAQVMTNNIQVGFLAFAGGLTFGALTVLVVLFNGLQLGAVAGVAIGAGNGGALLRVLSAHGPLELTCIVVDAAAGLRVGWALVHPGYRSRGGALVQEARAAVEIALGTVPWFVVCGLAEGFLTGPGIPLAGEVAIGGVLFALFWGLVLGRGAQRRPRDFARR